MEPAFVDFASLSGFPRIRIRVATTPDLTRMLEEAASLRTIARRLARDDAEASDLVQDTYVRAIEHAPRPNSTWSSWLRTILRNRVRDVRRSERVAADRARLHHREFDETRTPAELAGDAEERVKLQRALAQALLELDESDRTLVVQAWIDGVPGPVLARHLGITHDALRQRLTRARTRLRARLDREYGSRAAWCAVAVGDPPFHPAPLVPIGVASVTTLQKIAVAAVSIAALVAVSAWFVGGDSSSPAQRATAHTSVHELQGLDAGMGTPRARDERVPVDVAEVATAPPASARTIDRERDLHGVVVDLRGAPVPGARIRVLRLTGAGFVGFDIAEGERPRIVATDVSDAQGQFAIPLERGLPYSLLVDAAGFAPVYRAQCNAGERVVVELEPPGSLAVEILDADGVPVSDARVRVTRSPFGDDGWTRWTVGTANLDTSGRALLAPLPSGEVTIEVTPMAGGWPVWDEAQITRGAMTEKRITFAARQRVEGIVLEAATRRPIVGAHVGCAKWFGDATTTGLDGRFALEAFPLEFSSIHAWADGFAPARGQVERDEMEHILHPVTILLEAGFELTGTVVDERGTPVADAYVATIGARREVNTYPRDDSSVRSDAQGRFRLPGVRRGFGRGLLVRSDGRASVAMTITDPANTSNELDVGTVVLGAPAYASGILVDESGRPIAGCGVVLVHQHDESSTSATPIDPLIEFYSSQRTARTDDIGRFAFTDLAAGEYSLSGANGHEYLPDDSTRIRLGAGERREGIRLSMRDASTIRGRVVLPNGNKAASVRIVVASTFPPHTIATTVTEADGTFLLSGVQPGENRLLVRPIAGSPEYGPLLRLLRADERDVDLHLPRPESFTGRILHADGRPATEVSVRATDGATGLFICSGTTDAVGRFELVVATGMRFSLDCAVEAEAGEPALSAHVEAVTLGDSVELVLRAGS